MTEVFGGQAGWLIDTCAIWPVSCGACHEDTIAADGLISEYHVRLEESCHTWV